MSQDGVLTDRERDVLGLLSYGLQNKQAAVLLGVEELTVRKHAQNLRRKLGARNTAHAVSIAFERGILR